MHNTSGVLLLRQGLHDRGRVVRFATSQECERLEPRVLLTAAPIEFGAVYTEQDLGSDSTADTIEIQFKGGAEGTQLTRLEIDGDQFTPGLSIADMIFDTQDTGLGVDLPFHGLATPSVGDFDAQISIEDGSSLVVIELTGFDAGEILALAVDVDEVLDFDPEEQDLQIINEELDPIASGAEFQGSMLRAEFTAPFFHPIEGEAEFRNRYDSNLEPTDLDLPLDDAFDNRDRTAGAVGELQQEPLPISISGRVFEDRNTNLIEEAGDEGIVGVELSLFVEQDGEFVFTGERTITNLAGDYEFGADLGLLPGTYEIRETQPDGYFSVGSLPGTVEGELVGAAETVDVLTAISIPNGGTAARDYNFAEARLASIRGRVQLSSPEGDCWDESVTHEGIAGVRVLLLDDSGATVAETLTNADGGYEFTDILPGQYSVVELTPEDLFEAGAQAGNVDGDQRGFAETSRINDVELFSGDDGVDFDFCDHPPAKIAGQVYHDRNNDGVPDAGEEGIADALLSLLDEDGQLIDTVRTDEGGRYEFVGLRSGNYRVIEMQPDGWLDGKDRAGSANGRETGSAINPGDEINGITLLWGDAGIDFDFGELKPGQIEGRVHLSTPDGDCWDIDEDLLEPVAGAVVQLLDATGQVLAESVTDADGNYIFEDLPPGEYGVREITPEGLIDAGAQAGEVDGSPLGEVNDAGDIVGIQLGSDQRATNNDFCEHPPATISGFVFDDVHNDGRRDAEDAPIEGVVMQLLDENGNVVAEAVTDADGRYEFTGLPAGRYSIRQLQPDGFLDGTDSAGTIDGERVGRAENPGDQIVEIDLRWGDEGVDYNFAEIRDTTITGSVHSSTAEDCWNDPDAVPVAGVKIILLDESGTPIAETVTDEMGNYSFEGLRPGAYSIEQIQPEGLFDGGTRAGSAGGDTSFANRITQIELSPGEAATDYDFCERPPAMLSGFVFEDLANDGKRDGVDRVIANVVIQLVDEGGVVVAETVTDERGFYEFADLPAGKYALREVQPGGFADGLDTAGTIDGTQVGRAINPGDEIVEIELDWGGAGVEYNFAEFRFATIAGTVHSSPNEDCWNDEEAEPVGGVRILLYDEVGTLVAETQTNAEGRYKFEGLSPGRYSIEQIQPGTQFDGTHRAGSAGGDATLPNRISDIDLLSGDQAAAYEFCELPASTLSGFVFVDGEPVELAEGESLPGDLSGLRDGQLTADDRRLANVVIELRNGVTGIAIDGSEALPDQYADGPIRTTTNDDGSYRFDGLPRGNYAVYEIQPEGFEDGIDTAGTTDGVALNPILRDENEPFFNTLVGTLAVQPPANDAILRIALPPGVHSQLNNFSEVTTRVLPPPSVPPILTVFPGPSEPPPGLFPALPELYALPRDVNPVPLVDNPIISDGAAGARSTTWHLSVIDGGQPRATLAGDDTSVLFPTTIWQPHRLAEGEWSVAIGDADQKSFFFGMRDSYPVTGDFNGDGATEIGVFSKGHWFIDLNGNGRWESNDLWAKLGYDGDQPVVGDWDGDGKDDIGIFGRSWPDDSVAIREEHGLPDMENQPDGSRKNMPPKDHNERIVRSRRIMKHTARGQLREDVIDHVFLYGSAGDVGVVGDWNGDGIDSIGIFRGGIWHLDVDGNGRWTDPDEGSSFGRPGDVPIVGDFNGDGIDDLAILRNGKIYLDANGNRELDVNDLVLEFNQEDALPVVGKWLGDGKDHIGEFKPIGDDEPLTVASRPETK